MNEYRQNLADRMIDIYGLENPIVVDFVRMCEEWEVNDWNDSILRILVEVHEDDPIYDEDEEEN